MNINGFLTNLATQTSSTETLRAYRQDLEKYEAFLRLKGLRVTQAKPSTISEFINHLNDKNGSALAPASVSPTGLLRRISRQLQALGDRAGVGPIPISVFRHSFFKRLFLAGASAESVQFLGGYRTPFLTIESFLTNEGVYEMAVHDQASVEKQQ